MDTLKALFMGLVVVLCVLVSAAPASAQFHQDPLSQVMNQNMALTCMGPGTVWIQRVGCVRFSSGQYWLLKDQYGRRLSRPVKIALGGAFGAAVGNVVSNGSTKGTIIGAAVGAGTVGLIDWIASRKRNNNQNDEPIVIDEGQQVRIGRGGVPVAVGRPVYQPVSAGAEVSEGTWVIRNLTGGKGELWNGDQFIKLMEPGQSYRGSNPQGSGYRLVILVPSEGGTVDTHDASIVGCRDGWAMVAPESNIDKVVACQ